MAFSPDGRWIAASGTAGRVMVRDGKTGELLHTFRGHTGPVYRVAFLFGPQGKRLVS